ncbi:MAG: ABC transporter substrate-binding protein [Gemmatimonadota bacterium]
MKSIHSLLMVLVTSALYSLTACTDRGDSERSEGEAADTGGTAVVALATDLDHANILATNSRYTQEVLRYVLFLPLVHYDEKLSYQPALAESYESHGDTAITFKLRRDVFWHDGQQTNAYDVAFTFQRAADTATAFPNADWLIGWGAPQVLDSFTVRFPLERMADPLAGVALLPIMPRHLLESTPAGQMAQAGFNRKPIGNGPFKFVEYRANDRWVFETNERYPEELGKPRLRGLVLRVIPEASAQAIELQTGSVHLATGIPVEQYQPLDADSSLRGIPRDSRQYGFIPWNARRPPLNDARVRRALTMAIDRAGIVRNLRGGFGEPATGPVGKYHWAYDESAAPLPYSPDSARALLAQAGLRDRNGDNLLERADGSTWQIELKVPSGSAFMRDAAELIRSNLAAVGVRVVPRTLDFNTIGEDLTSSERNFDAALMGWENDLRLNFHDMFHSSALNGPLQFASYSNPAVDSIIDQAAAEPDRARSIPLWHRFQSILRADQPWTFIHFYPDLYVAREELQGTEMDIRGAFVNVTRWWIRK